MWKKLINITTTEKDRQAAIIAYIQVDKGLNGHIDLIIYGYEIKDEEIYNKFNSKSPPNIPPLLDKKIRVSPLIGTTVDFEDINLVQIKKSLNQFEIALKEIICNMYKSDEISTLFSNLGYNKF